MLIRDRMSLVASALPLANREWEKTPKPFCAQRSGAQLVISAVGGWSVFRGRFKGRFHPADQ